MKKWVWIPWKEKEKRKAKNIRILIEEHVITTKVERQQNKILVLIVYLGSSPLFCLILKCLKITCLVINITCLTRG